MKKLLISFLILLTHSSLAQVKYREATQDEKKHVLKAGDEESLKELGATLAVQTEASVIEKNLMTIALTDSLSKENIKTYVQFLTNSDMKKDEISQRIKSLGQVYFAELQLRSLEEVMPPEKQKIYQSKFGALEKRYQEGKLTHEELDLELSKLDLEISGSKRTQKNEQKLHVFVQAFEEVLRNEKFTKTTPPIDPKDFSAIKVMVPTDFLVSRDGNEQQPLCLAQSELIVSNQMELINQQLNSLTGPKVHQIWFAWGYNRATHSKTDVQFSTKDGTFTIHDAIGKDRQSPAKLEYLRPDKLTIPQYNLELGVMFNEKWGIDFHMDHMKYVFNNSKSYKITGDYNHQVATSTGVVDFSQAQANNDASWLKFEHTNGYNYASLGAVYNQKIFETKNKNFAIDARFGAGAGLMIPKTEVWIYQDQPVTRYGIDNKFHVAGGGVHGDIRLKITFWDSFFIQAATRANYIKVKDALVNGAEARLEHIQPITSFQLVGQIGYQYTFNKKKKVSKK